MNDKISNDSFKLAFFSVVLSIITYGFALSNYVLTVDSESPVYPDFSLALGRWGANLIRYHLIGPHIPYFTLLTGLLLLSMSSVIMVKMFKFSRLQGYLFCALFLSIPQLAYQLVFTLQADYVPLGFLLAIISTKIILSTTGRVFAVKGILHFIIASLLLMFTISLYQALILIPVVLFLIVFFRKSYLEDFNLWSELRGTIHFAAFMIFSLLLYYISTKVFCPDVETGYLSTYTSGESANPFKSFINVWFNNLIGKRYYGNSMYILCTIAVILLTIKFVKERTRFILRSLVLLLLLLLPFSLSFFITNGYHPPRLYIASGITFAFIVVQCLTLLNYEKISVVICSFVCLVNIYFITNLFYSSSRIFAHDKILATKIDSQIHSRIPNFDPREQFVYFYGGLPDEHHDKLRLPNSEIFGGSLFNWDQGNNYRIINFFNYNDIAQYKMIDNKDTFLSIQDSMSLGPVWPNPESVKKIGNVVVVKLGDNKGAPLPIE